MFENDWFLLKQFLDLIKMISKSIINNIKYYITESGDQTRSNVPIIIIVLMMSISDIVMNKQTEYLK